MERGTYIYEPTQSRLGVIEARLPVLSPTLDAARLAALAKAREAAAAKAAAAVAARDAAQAAQAAPGASSSSILAKIGENKTLVIGGAAALGLLFILSRKK